MFWYFLLLPLASCHPLLGGARGGFSPVPCSLFPVPFFCLLPSLPLPMPRKMTNLSIAIKGERILSGFEAVETEFYTIEIEAI